MTFFGQLEKIFPVFFLQNKTMKINVGASHISYLYRVNASRVELEVVSLDAVDPVEGDVEHAVQYEPDDVQRQEVEIQANHAWEERQTWSDVHEEGVHDDFHLPLPPPILVNLGVERDGPGDEINPANDIADDVQRLEVGDGYQDEGILGAEEVDE